MFSLSVSEISKKLYNREFSSYEITKAFLERIHSNDKDINAYITVCADLALQNARESDKRIACGNRLHELDGVPYALKDNICTCDVKTTCASRMLENYIPQYSATVAKKLEEKGAVLLGKVNMDEFAMGSSTEHSAFGVTKNPYNHECVAGGSSGGSAACITAGEAAFSIGTDTGGSIRQPSSFCNVVGMKPTYGSVSRYGLVAFACSLDQIGPMTRNVVDNAIVLNAVSGADKFDATSVDIPSVNVEAIERFNINGTKIALPKECFESFVDAEVSQRILDTARICEKLGAEVEYVSMPELIHALSAYCIISSAEASSNLARFDGVRFGSRASCDCDVDELIKSTRTKYFGDEVKRRIMLGTFVLNSGKFDEYFSKAKSIQNMIKRLYNDVFNRFDVILTPVSHSTSFRIGENHTNPTDMYKQDMLTVPASLAGIPAVSVPVGFSKGGLPIGAQLVGKAYSEQLLYNVAHVIECNKGDFDNEIY